MDISEVLDHLNLKDKTRDTLELAINEIANNGIHFKNLKVIYQGIPKPQSRPRVTTIGGNVRLYDRSERDKRSVKVAVLDALPDDFRMITESPIIFECNFYLPIPKAFSKKKVALAELGLLRPTKKPDIDNLEKLVYDALNGIIYKDDSLVVESHINKYYSINPRIEMEFIYVDESSMPEELKC